MPLFKRSTSNLQIPPVESKYDPSFDSGSSSDLTRDRYSRSNGVGDAYTRAGATAARDLDHDRSELFSGYNPAKSGSGRFFAPGANETEEEEEDVEAIKQKTRFVKQESVKSTRSAIQLAREAVETSGNTLKRLGEQSERLANTERHLDVAKGHSARAEDKTEELRKLNRSIFIPVITFDKDAKRGAKEAKVQRRYEAERAEREKTMLDVRETQERLGRAQMHSGTNRARSAGGSRFQFEADASDEEMENELDRNQRFSSSNSFLVYRNLSEIEGLVQNLKFVGTTMGEELDRQKDRISAIDEGR
ncbi:hypothetical protein C8J57DRAFT_1432541 [Mycena rebaudengoi]|nr:hypothetical protein C8J57DRAFT_1432541 [Mycena rebaudengoi]